MIPVLSKEHGLGDQRADGVSLPRTKPNTCSEGGCQGFFTVLQDAFAKLCQSGALRRLSAWS
jgi:hypothetical protein